MHLRIFWLIIISAILYTCQEANPKVESTPKLMKIITVDPGHFHAALVQKVGYEEVDEEVHVYAPKGDDVKLHMDRISGFNSRTEAPTNWNSIIYEGPDFFEKMIEEKNGNVVVFAGNNAKKTEYIFNTINAGLNVLADKPMVINRADYDLLKNAFNAADNQGVLLYDVMTERFEITSMLQKALINDAEIFGELLNGTLENPAITKESVHHFFKYVSGNILTRPPWFFDIEQEGEGIVDVMTHLVDLVQWQCFSEELLSADDVEILEAKRFPTQLTQSEFKSVTKLDAIPSYLNKDLINDSTIAVYCNGEINYKLKELHAKTSVIWNFRAPEGAKDTHYSTVRGSKANLSVKQGAEQNYKATLYIEVENPSDDYSLVVEKAFQKYKADYPGIALKSMESGWEIIIPEALREGHEAHFASVTEKFIEYLQKGQIPAWEKAFMLTKYHTTTKAFELANQ